MIAAPLKNHINHGGVAGMKLGWISKLGLWGALA